MNMYPIYPIWMRDELGLSGTKLLLYANIYHNTRNGQQTFNLSLLAWWCGVSTRQLDRLLNDLINDGALTKEASQDGSAVMRTLRQGVLTDNGQDVGQNVGQSVGQSVGHFMKDKERSKEKEIKENNSIACVKEKSASAQGEILNGRDKFVAPEWNEVWAYALTRGATAEEAQKFYAYYSMNGWKNKGVPLENWKAALGYWLLNNRESRSQNSAPAHSGNYAPGGSPAGYHGTGASPAGGSPVSKEEQFRAAKMSLQAERDAEFIRRKHEREAAEAEAYKARQAERAAMQHDDALRAAQQAFFANHTI